MRQRDELPLDPRIVAELAAIDATLAGEAVDPAHAEIAELALLLSAEKPIVRPAFADSLDARVQRRFARDPRAEPSSRSGGSRSGKTRPWRRLWPAAGAFATVAAAAVVALVVLGGGSGRPVAQDLSTPVDNSASSAGAPHTTSSAAATSTTASTAASTPAKKAAAPPDLGPAPERKSPSATGSGSAASTGGRVTGSFLGAGGGSQNPAPVPQPNGRKTIQSAQLALMVAPARIDTVAQEAFDVIGEENGIVNHSSVTSGSGGYAQIQLSVPSADLATTMRQLSELRYATVSQRTDLSQDVNDEYLSDVRRLADARALRTSLLTRLATAVTVQQIDSLNTQIHDIETTISSDQTTIDSLNKQVNLSQIELTINAGSVAVPVAHHASGGGFTLHRAAHDAGRVLVVVAGVALITLAALVPIVLLVALARWIVVWLRRRGREQALDGT
jgi:hypothetical protein